MLLSWMSTKGNAFDTESNVASMSETPIFIAHGTADDMIPVAMGEAVFSGLKSSIPSFAIEFLSIPKC